MSLTLSTKLAEILRAVPSIWGGDGGGSLGPTNTVAPAVTGTLGGVLTSTSGTWTGEGTITYAYQWYSLTTGLLGGETANTYSSADDDAVYCRVTATDDSGSRSANSNSVIPTNAMEWNSSLMSWDGGVMIWTP